jgi:2-polyprenyl-3-methyl-5-hydroxy-6-metoxy-1,4-benzoquinol methylase
MSYSQKVYDQLANTYQDVSQERRIFLSAIDNIIIPQITKKDSLLDLGSGDGIRTVKIAEQAQISHITLVENSHEMVKKCKQQNVATVVESNIEDFQSIKKFDVITCLWNVLGNVESYNQRVNVFKNVKSLLQSDGIFFFDVLNRYNAAYYGYQSVAGNLLRDLFRDGNEKNKIYTKYAGSQKVMYNVHYFTHNEVLKMIENAGLDFKEVVIVDYVTGKQREHFWQGQLLYNVGL